MTEPIPDGKVEGADGPLVVEDGAGARHEVRVARWGGRVTVSPVVQEDDVPDAGGGAL